MLGIVAKNEARRAAQHLTIYTRCFLVLCAVMKNDVEQSDRPVSKGSVSMPLLHRARPTLSHGPLSPGHEQQARFV